MADAPSLKQIEQLVAIAEQYGLEEVAVTQGEQTIRVKGFAALPVTPAHQPDVASAAFLPRQPKRPRQQPAADTGPKGIPVHSPMTGVFYRSPSPDAPPFVEEGDQIIVGQAIGIIEAMKVFSEVPAEQPGTVTQIVAANGKLLQAGDIILYMEPEASELPAET